MSRHYLLTLRKKKTARKRPQYTFRFDDDIICGRFKEFCWEKGFGRGCFLSKKQICVILKGESEFVDALKFCIFETQLKTQIKKKRFNEVKNHKLICYEL